MKKYISGWLFFIGGVVLEIFSILTIHSDKNPQALYGIYYTYEAPLTGHELFMILLVILAAASIIAGITLLVKNKTD